VLHDLGRWDELLETADEVRRVEEQHGAAQPGAMAQTYAALVHVRRGNLVEADAIAERALSHSRVVEDPQVLGPALVVSALVEEAKGNTGAALRHVEEFREVTRDRPFFRAQNLTDAVRVACSAGDVDLAASLLDNVVTAAEWDRLAAHTARATIADAGGEAATELYAEAAEGWERLGCVFEQALALRGAGDHDVANATLEELGVPPPPAQTAARTAK
jgi:tetratricopeptide (TPR) repeat protein